jgi:hypothetical protein
MGEIKILYIPHADEFLRKKNGVTQLFFYQEKNGEYFLGSNNKNIAPSDIQEMLSQEKISELKEPVIIKSDETLFIDYANLKVYSGDFSRENLKPIGILKNLIK